MFLFAMFLMAGPVKEIEPGDVGHENIGFSMERIPNGNGVAKNGPADNSRL